MVSEKRRGWRFSTRKLMWLIFILTSFIAMLILCAATHTSLLHLDAYNTNWNDEAGYRKAVRIISFQGFSSGVASYNEVASSITAYKAYTIFAYIPYVIISFLTGISTHNFICACNVVNVNEKVDHPAYNIDAEEL